MSSISIPSPFDTFGNKELTSHKITSSLNGSSKRRSPLRDDRSSGTSSKRSALYNKLSDDLEKERKKVSELSSKLTNKDLECKTFKMEAEEHKNIEEELEKKIKHLEHIATAPQEVKRLEGIIEELKSKICQKDEELENANIDIETCNKLLQETQEKYTQEKAKRQEVEEECNDIEVAFEEEEESLIDIKNKEQEGYETRIEEKDTELKKANEEILELRRKVNKLERRSRIMGPDA